jgi:predicted 3-demethylubiquinone-9 3-methyltransferase (glyoxalase superfamily)
LNIATVPPSTRAREGCTVAVQSLAPCLVFQDRCEQAINFYVSLFPNSRIVSLDRWRAGAPIPEGKVMHAVFELNGREYRAFDGGEHFKFS